MTRPRMYLTVLLALLMFTPVLAAQPAGYVTGTVTDATNAAPLPLVRVEVSSQQGAAMGSVLTNDAGQYRVPNIPPGVYTVTFMRVGYGAVSFTNVQVNPGLPTIQGAEMQRAVFQLNPTVISISRREERILEAPASVSVVDSREIERRPSLTVADHLKGLPGVDVSAGGLVQSNIVARGFNNAFSGALLTLIDNRFASVPSLRVNVPALFATTTSDIERMEVVLGPASALYGPNSANGVLAIITKSPFESAGTTLGLEVGDRGIFKGNVRHAGVFGGLVGYKFSYEKMVGNDFRYFDPDEPSTVPRPPSPGENRVPTEIRRDFGVDRSAGELRFDLRPGERTEVIGSYGFSTLASGIELTGSNGAAQARDWTYRHLQLRVKHADFALNIFRNFSDAGNSDSLDSRGTFLLRSGSPIVDQSRTTAMQAQQLIDLGPRQEFMVGADFIKTEPRTVGTINGRNEEIDNMTEWGAYIHSRTVLSDKFDFVGALRTDHNSVVDEQLFSPRLAVVFKPDESNNIRLTYNRAFFTPGNFTFFLDLPIQRLDPRLPYFVRTLGNNGGFTYRRDCADGVQGLCMKTPFSLTPNAFVNAGGTDLYRSGMAVLAPGLTALLTQQYGAATAAQVVGGLLALTPTNEQVGGRLAVLTPARTFAPVTTEWSDIDPLTSETYDVFEAGYKGLLGERAKVAVDVWYQNRENFTGPATNITPSVFITPGALAAYLTTQLTPQVGPAAAAVLATQIADSMAPVPLGTVVPDHELANSSDLRFSYYQFTKKFGLWGADLALDYMLADKWLLGMTYSWVSEDFFPEVFGSGFDPLSLNAPDNKATATLNYVDDNIGLNAEFRGRYSNAFPVSSGVYQGTVPVRAVFDLGASYRIPGRGNMLVSMSVTNLLNNSYVDMNGNDVVRPSFIGVPGIGRLASARLQITF